MLAARYSRLLRIAMRCGFLTVRLRFRPRTSRVNAQRLPSCDESRWFEILREGIESSRFRSTAITRGVGKDVPLRASLRGCGEGGHALLCPPYAASSSSGRGVLAISQDLKTDIRVRIPTHDLATGNNIGR